MTRLLPSGTVLASTVDLEEDAARGFALSEGEWPLTGFVVRVGDHFHAYLNRCPHALRPLNFLPDRFLSKDRAYIQCNSHGAQFEKDTGLCIAGPCMDESLRRLPVAVVDGEVRLTADLDLDRLERSPFR